MQSHAARLALTLTALLCMAPLAHAQDPADDAMMSEETPALAPAPLVADKPEAEAPQTTGAVPAKPAASDSSPKVKLTISSWGGAYEQSQRKAYFDPFAKQSDHEVDVVTHGGDEAEITAKLTADPSPWDVVDLGAETVANACDEGLLEPIDAATLTEDADGGPAQADFFAHGLQKCGVASVAWAATIVHNRRAFDKQAPQSLADVFDAGRFAGKRALPKSPKYTLELALLADGVAPSEVYRTLETEDGIARAFASLDRIKESIVWWQSAQEPLKLLADGDAAIALAFNGRIFSAIVRDHEPLEIIWDGQIYDLDLWAIPKHAQHKDAARQFIAFATEPKRLAAQTKWFPYGPMRKSALTLVSKHAEADVNMADFLPTASGNFDNALRFDGAWWKKNLAQLQQRFDAWLTKPKQLPEAADEDGDSSEE